jgi:hypothetical protein
MKVNELLIRPFRTPFDDFDLSTQGLVGASLRTRLDAIQSEFGRLNELASIASYQEEIAETRMETAQEMAFAIVNQECAGERVSVAVKQSLGVNKEVLLPGDSEKTTPYKENMKHIAIKYVAKRGKDKINELTRALDLGRSLLSWDKEELGQLER